jgi:hypothetical protein
MRVEAALQQGSRVLVDVQIDADDTLECYARVVWCASDAAGDQFVGLRFETPMPGLVERLQRPLRSL